MKVTHAGKAWFSAFGTGVCTIGACSMWVNERYLGAISSLAAAGLGVAIFDRSIQHVANKATTEAN